MSKATELQEDADADYYISRGPPLMRAEAHPTKRARFGLSAIRRARTTLSGKNCLLELHLCFSHSLPP